VDRFSKFFHQVILKKILYVHITKISTSPAICCYTTLWKSKIQRCYWLWQHFNRLLTLWGLDLTFNSSYIDCFKTAHWLTDWLTFWSLSDDVSNQQLNFIQLNIVASWQFFHHDYLCTVFVLSRLYFICCTHIEVKSFMQYYIRSHIKFWLNINCRIQYFWIFDFHKVV